MGKPNNAAPTAKERQDMVAFLRANNMEKPGSASVIARIQNATDRDGYAEAICELHGVTLEQMRTARVGG
jgi:hypothetical protein